MGDLLLLPDCRPTRPTNVVRGAWGYWVPIFCANCGAPGGLVPEENMTFAFYLCEKTQNDCAGKWGHVAATEYTEPDVAFWERVNQEQLARYGRLLTPRELRQLHESGSSPLATLLRNGG